jgi:hypothetical protein
MPERVFRRTSRYKVEKCVNYLRDKKIIAFCGNWEGIKANCLHILAKV